MWTEGAVFSHTIITWQVKLGSVSVGVLVKTRLQLLLKKDENIACIYMHGSQ